MSDLYEAAKQDRMTIGTLDDLFPSLDDEEVCVEEVDTEAETVVMYRNTVAA